MRAFLRVLTAFLLVTTSVRAETQQGVSFSLIPEVASEAEQEGDVHTGPLVGSLGDPAAIQFVGMEKLTAKQLRGALALDLSYQAAARPSATLAQLLSVLEDRLAVGLQYSGFANATATVTYNAQSNEVHVSISEGDQFKNGSIRIEGVEKIDGNLIAEQLVVRGKSQPWTYFFGECETCEVQDDNVVEATWKKGEVTRSDKNTIERLKARIRQLMIEQGYPFATFTVAVDPETADTAALVIRIAKEGAAGTLSDLKVTGLTRHSEEQLLDYLSLKQGSPINARVLDDIHSKLRDSCRFWGHKLSVRVPNAGTDRYGESPKGLELAITLTEYEHVPTLDKPLSAEEESMKRFAHWLERHGVERFSESGDLVIQSSLPSAEADTNFRCVISPQQGMLLDANGEIGGLYAIHHAVIAGPGRAELVNRSRKSKLTVGSPSINSVINIQWTSGNVENGEYRSSLLFYPGLSQRHDSSPAWSIACDPVAAVHVLYREDAKFERGDGELRVQSPSIEFCIEEATGRLKHMSLKGLDGQNLSVKASFESGAFEQAAQDIRNRSRTFTECYDTDEPVMSIANFAIDEMVEQPFVQRSQLRQLVLATVRGCLDRDLVEKLASALPIGNENKSEIDFDIPPVEFDLGDNEWNECLALIGRAVPAAADKLFPRGSWPWTYTREAAFHYAASKPRSSWDSKSEIFWEGAESEVQRVFKTTDPGPLASLVPLMFFQEYIPGEAIEILVQRGRQELNVESLTSDILLLSHCEPMSDPVVASCVLQTDRLSDSQRQALRDELPPMATTLMDMLIERRENHEGESVTQSLEAVIEEAWPTGLSDSLADFLSQFDR